MRLPAQITQISEGMFAYCKNLKSIEIPAECKDINRNAFYHCTSLHTVTVGEAESSFWCMSDIGKSAFEGCSSLRNIDLSQCNFIREKAFKGCKSLQFINLYGASIYAQAFYGCTALKEVIQLSGNVGEKTFYGCKKLKKIDFYGEPFEIEKDAFKNINPKAVFISQKKYAKKWKKALTKKVGFKKTMKIKSKKNEN